MKTYLLLSATILCLILALFVSFRIPETDGYVAFAICAIVFIVLFCETVKHLWEKY